MIIFLLYDWFNISKSFCSLYHFDFLIILKVTCGDELRCEGIGPNKKLAKRAAAEIMLAKIGYVKPMPKPGKSLLKKRNNDYLTKENQQIVDVASEKFRKNEHSCEPANVINSTPIIDDKLVMNDKMKNEIPHPTDGTKFLFNSFNILFCPFLDFIAIIVDY